MTKISFFSTSSKLPKLALTTLSCLVFCLLLSGCIKIYKKDILQGNHVTQEMVDQLKPEMSKLQVQDIMGSPALIPVCKLSRWDYYYNLQPGDGSSISKKSLSLYFVKDKLAYFTGDWVPANIQRKPK